MVLETNSNFDSERGYTFFILMKQGSFSAAAAILYGTSSAERE